MADPIRVIVVDDEPDIREVIAAYLGKYGFIVSGAADGQELEAYLASDSPDLLILDVNLPGEDGFAIARRVRARSAVPIMMLTAAGDTVDRVVGLELGADDYVTKPFDLRELRARIQAVLRRTGGTRRRLCPGEPVPKPASGPPQPHRDVPPPAPGPHRLRRRGAGRPAGPARGRPHRSH